MHRSNVIGPAKGDRGGGGGGGGLEEGGGVVAGGGRLEVDEVEAGKSLRWSLPCRGRLPLPPLPPPRLSSARPIMPTPPPFRASGRARAAATVTPVPAPFEPPSATAARENTKLPRGKMEGNSLEMHSNTTVDIFVCVKVNPHAHCALSVAENHQYRIG